MVHTSSTPAPESATSAEVETRPERVSIRLRLATESINEPAELWVLKYAPFVQLQQFVEQTDDRIISRLLFAMAQPGDSALVVIRTRSNRLQPPDFREMIHSTRVSVVIAGGVISPRSHNMAIN